MEGAVYGVILNLFSNIEVLVWAWGICQVKLQKNKRRWMETLFLYHLEMLLVFGGYFGETMAFLLKVLGNMVIITLLMQGPLVQRVIQYWFSIFYLGIVYQPIYFFVSFLEKSGSEWERIFIKGVASLTTIGVVLFAAKQIKRREPCVRWIRNISLRYYTVGLISCFCANGIHYYMIEEIRLLNMQSRIFWGTLTNILYLFLYSLGIGLAFVNLLKEYYRKESAQKGEYLRMAKAHDQEMVDHMREIRSIRHDMRAHMNALENFIKKEQWGEAEEYLHKFQQEIQLQSRKTVSVGNELVNAVIENELVRADYKIDLQVEGAIPSQMDLEDFDLCVLFSNLFSNAVEACGQLQKQNRKIRLCIHSVQKNLVIQMENPMEHSLDVKQLGNLSWKKECDNHGYGIYNIKKTVEKYGGDIEIQVEDGVYKTRIFFYQMIKSC